jgi:predicted HTH transcriptional regulator
MTDLIERALKAKRESKYIEFKASFNTSSAQDWCEIIKDIVAIANSGGGIIIFGVDDRGLPLHKDLSLLLKLDPADIANKVLKYTATYVPDVEIVELDKNKEKVV